MDEAIALRQLRKLWKGSGLRVCACPKPEPSSSVASTSTSDASKNLSSAPRRQTLADFEMVTEPAPPKPDAAPPPPPRRRLDIGLSLNAELCVGARGGVVALGKRPMSQSAAASDEAERKRTFRESQEQALEAERLHRARELEKPANIARIMQQSLDAWRITVAA